MHKYVFLQRGTKKPFQDASYIEYIVACQRGGVSNGQRQDTGPGILWSVHKLDNYLDKIFLKKKRTAHSGPMVLHFAYRQILTYALKDIKSCTFEYFVCFWAVFRKKYSKVDDFISFRADVSIYRQAKCRNIGPLSLGQKFMFLIGMQCKTVTN